MDINLTELEEKLPNSFLNRAPPFLRIKTKEHTAMLYRTGKIIVTGITHPMLVEQRCAVVTKMLRDLVQIPLVYNIRVKTIMAIASIKTRVCPYKLTELISSCDSVSCSACWEPEIDNAILIQESSRGTLRVFPSTGTILAFGKSFDHMCQLYYSVLPFLKNSSI